MEEDTPYVDVLGDRPYFSEVDEDDLVDLVDTAEPRTLMTGDGLWSRGDEGRCAYILMSGRIELAYKVQPDGKREEVYDEPGAILGAAYLVHGWEHESSAYPVERSEVLELSRESFRRLFDARHPAAYRIVDILAEQMVEEVRDANRRLQDVFGHPAETLRTLRRRARD